MNVGQVITIEQKNIISQNQIQSLELLTMGTHELSSFLENEYLENPMLEHITGCTKNKCSASADDTQPKYNDIPDISHNSIESFIKDQLDSKHYSKNEWHIIETLIKLLDDDGYFKFSISDVETITGADADTIAKCLSDLKHLEPCGVFSSSLHEYLIFQTTLLGINDETLKSFIMYCLEDAVAGKVGCVAKKLGTSVSNVRNYLNIVSQLSPRPFSGLNNCKTEYIVPDIIIRLTKNGWEIVLNDAWINDYKISDYYIEMYRSTTDSELKNYFKVKWQRVRFVMDSIEQRRKTIYDVCKAITEIQGNYFSGKCNLLPMSMADIAKKLDISISTVSRAIKNKYIQLPEKTVAIKSLFSANVGATMAQPECTPEYIKSRIKYIISHENCKKPLSDQSITKSLLDSGISVSRRVVAKYRTELGISCSSARRIP